MVRNYKKLLPDKEWRKHEGGFTRVNFALSAVTKERMAKHKGQVNWSEVVEEAVKKKLKEVEGADST